MRHSLSFPLRCASGLAVACVLTGCSRGSASTDEASRLAAALESVPGVAPRLSLATAFRRCSEQTPPEGTITRADCPPRRSSRRPLIALARAVPAGDDAATLHARAIVDLVVPDERGIALDRAITSLRRLQAMVDRPAPVLADLSAALIVRAERTQAPRDLLEAYEIAEQALKHEPRSLAALYNRALALDRFGLVDETARDWQAYLAADSTSRWADDARRRRRALLAIQPPPRPAPDAALAEYTRYAAADPQGARELGMDHLLGEWGAAILTGDAVHAADRLARAAALGDALERRPGGDASLADMVRAIRSSSPNSRARMSLARAHQEYATAMVLYDSVEYGRAMHEFGAAADRTHTSPVLRSWARLFWGTALVLNRAVQEGEYILQGVVANADTRSHPALAARARWSLGNTLNRGERWENGLAYARESATLFAAAGEPENEGGVLTIMVDSRFMLGEPDSAYTTMHRSLARLRPYRTSMRLHTMLTAGARHIEADGFFRSAVSLQTESISVVTRSGRIPHVIEARAARARLLAALGDSLRAHGDLRAARTLIGLVHAELTRKWLEADLLEVDALISRTRNAAYATQAFDSAASFFAHIPVRAFPYLVRGAEVRLATHDLPGATLRLESAIEMLEDRRSAIRMEPRRAAIFDAARAAVDRIVMLKLASGQVREALHDVDRARASLAPAAPTGLADDTLLAPPPGQVAVEYALIGDTLLAWTLRGSQVALYRTVVDTIRLVRAIEELEAQLQQQATEREVLPLLTTLYEWLMRPLELRLGEPGTQLVIVTDGVLAAVPFAALYDARARQYLIEEHSIRFAVSLREARRRPTGQPASGVLLVADPAHDPTEHPLLDRLPHARTEVRAFASNYTGTVLLEGPHATRRAFQSAIGRVGIVHFAGHAVFDDQRPERSYLVLASRSGMAGRITAEDLSQMDLRHLRLVVLAACRTVRAGPDRAGGFTGLSGALLAAGTHGTIGSIWDVSDRLTAPLIAEFHRRYQRSRDGPQALRDAQIALQQSPDPTLRSPAAWAGFRYMGG